MFLNTLISILLENKHASIRPSILSTMKVILKAIIIETYEETRNTSQTDILTETVIFLSISRRFFKFNIEISKLLKQQDLQTEKYWQFKMIMRRMMKKN